MVGPSNIKEEKDMNKKTKIEKKFIVGTEGQADYLVVAEQAGHLLGIKPLILQAPNCTYVGVRVRSVFKAQDGDVVDESDVVSMTHKEASPLISTSRTRPAPRRCSWPACPG